MNQSDRIRAFHQLGNVLESLPPGRLQSIAEQARLYNPWFTESNVQMAVRGIRKFLNRETLENWVSPYPDPISPRTVAVIMAGNIPMVGFHDLLAVLLSGHTALIKLSTKDNVLIRFLTDALVKEEPRFQQAIRYAEQLKNFDAVIATGSDNSSRYFEYYFSKYPNIIRKNRTSVAVLDGTETPDELRQLGTDIFSYFGMGCRNVSKLYLPDSYTPENMFPCWESFSDIIHHHKYHNNYDYQKSILLVNRQPFLDNGFVLLEESEKLVSPISVVYYSYYKDKAALMKEVTKSSKIQCIVSKNIPDSVSFGEAQYPDLTDYADQVDTLVFLSTLPAT